MYVKSPGRETTRRENKLGHWFLKVCSLAGWLHSETKQIKFSGRETGQRTKSQISISYTLYIIYSNAQPWATFKRLVYTRFRCTSQPSAKHLAQQMALARIPRLLVGSTELSFFLGNGDVLVSTFGCHVSLLVNDPGFFQKSTMLIKNMLRMEPGTNVYKQLEHKLSQGQIML